MNGIVLVCGPPASGKSTLSTSYAKGKSSVTHYDYGDLVVKFSTLNSKYDVINITNQNYIYNIDYNIISHLREEARNKNILLELHPVTLTRVGLIGFTLEQLYLLKGVVKGIIYIEASIQDILKMIEKDTERRPNYLIKDLEILRNFSKYYTSIYSVILGTPLYVVRNEYGRINDAIAEFSRAIDSF